MTELHVKVKNSSILFYVSITKRALQTLHSFEVNDFFQVVSHNFKISVLLAVLSWITVLSLPKKFENVFWQV